MHICVSCLKEMKVKKVGVIAVWRKSHAYSGDIFECDLCGHEVWFTAASSFQVNPDFLHPDFLAMDEETRRAMTIDRERQC